MPDDVITASGAEFAGALCAAVPDRAEGVTLGEKDFPNHVMNAIDITERKQAEESARRQMAFVEIINTILARFASCSGSDVDEAITVALQEVSGFVGADQGFVLQFAPDLTFWTLTHDWHCPEAPSLMPEYQRTPIQTYPWCEQQAILGATIQLHTMDDLPPDANVDRAVFEREQVLSMLTVPLRGRGNRILGCVGFRCYFRTVHWSSDILRWLQSVGDAIANVLERKRAEETLRESEERFRGIASNLPGFVYQSYIKDNGEGGLHYVDQRAQDMFGLATYPLETWYRRFVVCIAHSDRKRFIASIQKAIDTHGLWEFEGRFIKPTGEERYIRGIAQPVQLPNETVWNGLLLDITDRRRAAEELNQYRNHLEDLVDERTKELETSRKEALRLMQDANAQRQRAEDALEALRQSEEQLRKSELELRMSNEHLARAQSVAHVGHWTWDLTTDQITGSDEYHRIRGTTPDTLKNRQDVLNTIHPDDRQQWTDLVRAAMAGEKPYSGDYRIVLPDKNVKYLHVQGETTFDEHGKPSHIFGAVFDITDMKIAEMKLQKAMIEAETANRAKSLFLANMSHELRTPLTAVLGFSQLLRDDPALSETQRENLDIINRSGAHLLALINDVLDMSKIEAGQLTLQETVFNLSSVLETVEDMMRVRSDAKGLSFLLDRDPTLPRYIKADEKKLKQVLINLAGNAVKFTQRGGVVVRVRMEEDGNALKFDVEDTGPGIHAEELPNIFDRFVQVGESHEGVGLGLYISHKLVELMGGHITVESQPEKGTRFSFSIRCKPGTVVEATPEIDHCRVVGLAPGQPPPHILVVEDKLETRLLVVKVLQAVGFEVIEAENGHEAVKRFEASCPDLILMDMRMPIMDGYRATRKIKAMDRGKTTPIIALTASAFDDERQRTLAAGADDYLGKPIQVDELYEMIRVHLGIAYTHAEPQPNTTAACDRAGLGEMVASLPNDLTNGLAEAISALDLDRLMALLPEVASHAPVLSEQLAKLAKGYEIAKLAELLEARNMR